MSTITQRQSIAYTGTFPLLRYYLTQLSGDVEEYDVGEKQALRVFKAVNVVFEGRMVTLEWSSNPVNDMFVDAVVTVILKAESDTMPTKALPAPITIDKAHFRECLLEALSEMFGPECISPLIRGDKMSVTVDDKTALIDLNTLDVQCDEDDSLQQMVFTAVNKLHQAITPVKT